MNNQNMNSQELGDNSDRQIGDAFKRVSLSAKHRDLTPEVMARISAMSAPSKMMYRLFKYAPVIGSLVFLIGVVATASSVTIDWSLLHTLPKFDVQIVMYCYVFVSLLGLGVWQMERSEQ